MQNFRSFGVRAIHDRPGQGYFYSEPAVGRAFGADHPVPIETVVGMNRLNLQRQSTRSDQGIEFIPPANGCVVEIVRAEFPVTMGFDTHVVKRCGYLWQSRARLTTKHPDLNH